MNDLKEVIIYTDGASSGNPGPGGWGAVISREDKIKEIGGGELKTTNNRMEMFAAIKALEETQINDNISLYTDSSYLINGITKWIFGWIKNDWKTLAKQEVLNKDLWQELYFLTKDRKIKWVAVKGHAGSLLNNRVDEIAVSFSKNKTINLFLGKVQDYEFKVSAPTQDELIVKSNSSRKNQKAFSYLSMINGEIQKHKTWADCENRVKGQSAAKFRKTLNENDESKIIEEWKKENK